MVIMVFSLKDLEPNITEIPKVVERIDKNMKQKKDNDEILK